MMIYISALILIICGVLHSYLGEKFILIRLFKRKNLPHLYGSDTFTQGTLRFAWHITSLSWFGFAALLLMYNDKQLPLLYVVSIVFFLSALCSAFFTKLKHFSWWLFLSVSVLSFASAIN